MSIDTERNSAEEMDELNRSMGRWRAEPFKKSTYYMITSEFSVTKTNDKNRDIDLRRWKLGNYFENKTEAQVTANFLQNRLLVYRKYAEVTATESLGSAEASDASNPPNTNSQHN